MRHIVIIIILFLAIASSFAAEKKTDENSSKSAETETIKNGSRQKTLKEEKTPEWPRPYKPTEEISVDTTVPFPTDI